MKLWKHIENLRQKAPLVHNITNYVVMNNSANALLAAGASPIMAHAHPEIKDMVSLSSVLVINIGTLDEYWVQSMLTAAETAQQLGKPWVLDPVGAGASPYRNEVLAQLLQFKPTLIRGNASEIAALANAQNTGGKGVDSTLASDDALSSARALHLSLGSMVCISGATDYLLSQELTYSVQNGHPWMTKVTGLGCSLSAVMGAFLGSAGPNLEALAAALAYFGLAGELAQEKSSGPGTLQLNLLDALFSMDEETFTKRQKVSL